MILPSLLTIGTVEGIVVFLLLLLVRWRWQSAWRIKYEDILYLCVETVVLVGSTTTGIQAVYFGVTGEIYPGASLLVFGPQITIIGLALLVAPPMLLYQRFKSKISRRVRRRTTANTAQPVGTP